MAQKVAVYLVVGLIIGLIIGAGVGWAIAPKGVPEEEYKKVKTELETTKAELSEVKALAEKLKALIPEELAKAEGVIVIRAWPGAKAYDKYRLDNLKDAAELLNMVFKAIGLGITIKFEGTVESATLEKVIAAYKAGELVDILGCGHEWIGPYAEAGYIIPLDDYIKKYEILFKDWFPYPWAWESMKWKGKIYGILQDTECRPFYFRKDVLRKLGWTEEEIEALPEKIRRGEWTIEDAIAVAKEAMARGLVKYGFYHRPTPGAQPMFVFYKQFGGVIGDPATGKLVADKSAWLETLKLFYKMAYEEKTMPAMAGISWRTVHTDFVNGRVLFWFGGSWHWAEYQRVPYHEELGKVPEEWEWENLGFALVPAPRPGLKPATNTHPWAFMISSQSKYPELAFLIATIATLPTFDVRHCIYGGKLPARSTTYTVPEFKENKFLSSIVYMHEYTDVLFNNPKMPVYVKLVFEAVTAVEKGTPPDKALSDLISALKAEIGDEIIIRD